MKTRYTLLLLAIIFLGFYSCMPDMDLENPNEVTTGSYYKTQEEMIAAVNGAYNEMQRNGGWGRYMFMMLNGRGDDWTYTYKASNGEKETPPINNFTYNSSNRAIYECWDDMYVMMYASNLVLEKALDAEYSDTSIRTRVMGEAYFLRGLSLYYLGQLYGEEIPVNTSTPESVDDYYASAAEQGVLYEQMISDFKKAVQMLPVRSEMYANTDDVGRATKGSALGFLAKAYMNRPIFDHNNTDGATTTSDWSLAASALKQIIESSEYSLVDNYRDNHTETSQVTEASCENNDESLFEVQFDNGDGDYNDSQGEDFIETWGQSDQSTWREQEIGMKDGGDNTNWWNMMPLRKTYDEFETVGSINGTDNDSIADPRAYMTLWCQNGAKYCLTTGRWITFDRMFTNGKSDANYGVYFGCRKYCADIATADWESGINERLLRYSDVLLMYAECLIETGDENTAATYINMVRDRANLQQTSTDADANLFYTSRAGNLPTVQELIATAPTINDITINTMRRALKHERYVEFCGEGMRFMDLLRWYYNDNDPDQSTILNALTESDYKNAYTIGEHEYFCIPSTELATNPNMHGNRAN